MSTGTATAGATSSSAAASGLARIPVSASHATADAVPLQLCSYNLWFEPCEQQTRMLEAARVLSGGDDGTERPSAVAVQELTDDLLHWLQPRLKANGFHSAFKQPYELNAPNSRYGVALFTRPPLGPLQSPRFHPYPDSHMGRGLVLGVTHWPGVGRLVLGSTHLESFVGEHADGVVVPERRRQLAEAGRRLSEEARRQHCVGAVLLGDLNWDDPKDGDAVATIGEGWSDAFEALGRPHGKMATCYKWRFDRGLYWSNRAVPRGRTLNGLDAAAPAAPTSQHTLRAVALSLAGKKVLGEQPNGKRLCASDHKALLVTLEHGTGASKPTATGAMAVPPPPRMKKARVPPAGQPSKAPPDGKRRKSPWHPPPSEDVVELSD